MGVFDSNLGVVKQQLASQGLPNVRSLDDVLRQQSLAVPTMRRTLPAPPDLRTTVGTQPNPGGWEGFLSGVMDSLPGKLITSPLTVLSVPGKILPSIMEEFKNAVDGNPETKATWGDFARQLTDPNFGFGTVTGNLTGIKWIDRAIGFAGDVLLDPLTYTGLGLAKAGRVLDASGNVIKGSKALSLAGRDGRMAFAETLRKLGADPEVVKNAARRGRSAVADKDMLAKAGYDRAGIYFMGKRIKGTTAIGERIESGLTSFRIWSGDHFFNRIGDLFTPQDMMSARRLLARGGAPTEKVGDLLGMVLSRNEERAAEGAARRQAGQMRLAKFQGVSKEDIKASRATAYKYLDVNAPELNMATPEGRVAAKTRELWNDLHANIQKAGEELEPGFKLNFINSYLPYMIKDQSWRWMSDQNNPRAVLARYQTFDVFEETGAFKPRRGVGDMVGKHKLTQADVDAGIDRINEIYRKEFDIKFDFFETDLPTIITKYEAMYAGYMGKIARKKYLIERGAFKRNTDRLVSDPEIDKSISKQLEKIVSVRAKRQKKASEALDNLTTTLREIIDDDLGLATSEIDDLVRKQGAEILEQGSLSYKQAVLVRQLREAKDELNEAFSSFNRSIDGAADNMVIQAIDNRIGALVERMEVLAEEVNTLRVMDPAEKAKLSELGKEVASINKQLKNAIASEADIIQRGNLIAEHFESILMGADIAGQEAFSQSIRNSIKGTIGIPGGKAPALEGNIKYRRAIKGKSPEEIAVIKQRFEAQGVPTGARNQPWWDEIQALEPVSLNKVEKYAEKTNMRNLIQRLARGGGDKGKFGSTASLEETRAMGMALVAWMDSLPDDMKGLFDEMRTDLLEGIKQASQSTQYYKKLKRVRVSNKGVVTLGGILDNYDQVVSQSRQKFFQYFAADNLLNRIFSQVDLDTSFDEIVSTELIQRITKEEQFASLNPIFENFLSTRSDRVVDSFDEIRSLMNATEVYDHGSGRAAAEILRRYDDIGEQVISRTYDGDALTYGRLAELLEGLKKQSMEATYDLRLKTGSVLDDGIVDIPQDALGQFGRKSGDSVTVSVGDLISFYKGRWLNRREGARIASDSVANQSDYLQNIFKGWREWRESVRDTLRANGVNPTDRRAVRSFDEKVAREARRARAEMATGKISPEEMKARIKGAKDDLLEALDDELRPGEILSADQANERLSDLVMRSYYTLEVQSRFNALQDQMKAEGLVLGPDVYRTVMNVVARDIADNASAQIRTFDFAKRQLDEILDFIDGATNERARLVQIINDPQSLPADVRRAKADLASLPTSGGWLGREEDLYDGIVSMLGKEGPQWHDDWREVVSRANGRHDVQSLLAQARYVGGAKGTAGVVDKAKKLRQRLKASTDPVERESLKAEIASLPSKAQIKKMKNDLLKNKLRPWYSTLESSRENPSFEEIYEALKEYKDIAKSGGVLDPTASIQQMRDWVVTAQDNLANASSRVRKSFTWTLEAADPFVDPANFKIGTRTNQELPTVYALSLRRIADELEADLADLSAKQALAASVAAQLSEAGPAAVEAQRQLRELTRPGGRVGTVVPEDQVGLTKLARDLHNQVIEAKSSTPWVTAVERSELNEIIMELAKYASRQRTDLSYRVSPRDVAAEILAEGGVVYRQVNSANPEELAEMARLKKEINQIAQIFAKSEGSLYDAGKMTTDEIVTLVKGDPNKFRELVPFINEYESLVAAGRRQEAEKVLFDGTKLLPKDVFSGRVSSTTLLSGEKRSVGDRMEFARLKYEQDQKIKRLEELSKRNPTSGAQFRPVTDGARLKNGVVYFVLDEGVGLNEKSIAARYRQAKKFAQQGNEERANKIITEITSQMTPVVSRTRVLRVGDKNVSLSPDDIRGLFDDPNEFIIDVADDGTVRQFRVRDIALQNVSDILQSIKSGDLKKEDLFEALRYTSSTLDGPLYPVSDDVLTARRTALQEAWETSADKKLLDEISQIESSYTVASYRELLADRQRAIDFAEELRTKARLAVGDVAEEGAPYGFAPFNRQIYNATLSDARDRFIVQRAKYHRSRGFSENYSLELAQQEAKRKVNADRFKALASTKARSVPYEEPTVGTRGATYRYDKTFKKMNEVFEGIKRSVGGIYDPYKRFNDITSDGTSYTDAIKTIVKEVEDLRPPDPRWVDVSASALKYVQDAENLRYQLAFINSNSGNALATRWVYGSVDFDESLTGKMNTALKEMDEVGKEIEKLDKVRLKTLRKVMQPPYAEQKKGLASGAAKIKKIEETLSSMSVLFDNAALARMDSKKQRDLLMPMLQKRVDNLKSASERVEKIVASDDSLQSKHAELLMWLGESEDVIRELSLLSSPTMRPDTVINPNGVMDPTQVFRSGVEAAMQGRASAEALERTKDYEKFLTVKSAYLNAWHEMSIVDEFYNQALKTVEGFKDGEWGKIIPKELDKGLTTLEQIGLPSYYASEELLEMSKNMQQFIEPEFVRGVNKFLGRYTGFFKAYVTSTPGFIVRNTMSNTFMLVAGGASIRNMNDGIRLYAAWRKSVKEGTEAKFLDSLSKRGDVREIFDLAVRASDASGYGRGAESFAGWNPKTQILKDNRYTRFFREWNETSEGSARFIMAYDSAVKGYDFDTATARVKRYFFDYQDVSGVDQALRSIIPFWYWMSRNLPLQLANRWANPKAYLIYDKAMRAIRDDEEDQYTPSWMVKAGAIKLGDGSYLMADFGFSRVEEDIQKLANPFSGDFLDMLNPGLKVPIEMITNTRLKYGNQFRDEGQEPAAGPMSPAVQALAGLLGPFDQTRPTPSGQPGVTERFNYATRAMLPMLGQAERIAPATESGQSRIANSWLSYLGVPIRTVTQEDRLKERQRQVYEQNDLRRQAERGY